LYKGVDSINVHNGVQHVFRCRNVFIAINYVVTQIMYVYAVTYTVEHQICKPNWLHIIIYFLTFLCSPKIFQGSILSSLCPSVLLSVRARISKVSQVHFGKFKVNQSICSKESNLNISSYMKFIFHQKLITIEHTQIEYIYHLNTSTLKQTLTVCLAFL
jgi:hypothetical protein